MPKLQVLSGALAGQSYELKVDTTTVGRVEDNSFPIAEPSVSSHHCEIILAGTDVIVKDLNSTNGTFINGAKVDEAVLKPGQTLRLGQVELRLDDGSPLPPPSATPSKPATVPPGPGAKPRQDQTIAVQRGVSLDQLAEPRAGGFDTASSGFTKKTNKVNLWFIVGGGILGLIIVGVLIYVALTIKK
jgi:pSer/pThr/pTyr-binding forkhead associated (FHA) protein